jgi:hypothetical protein
MMKNELSCSPAQAGSLLRSDKLRGIKTKQCNVESNGELTFARRVSDGLVRPGGLNTESELLYELALK